MLHTKWRHDGAVYLECRIEKTQSYTFALSLQTSSLKIVKLENFEPTKFSRKSVKIYSDFDVCSASPILDDFEISVEVYTRYISLEDI